MFYPKLKKAAEFFEPENLADLILKYEGEVALLVIDVQKEFCDLKSGCGNKETEAISTRIQSLVPEFRKVADVYAVHYSYPGEEEVHFYKYTPSAGDTLVAKNKPSAFKGGDIKDILERDHKRLLLVCGFYQAACVGATATDAREAGFEVCLLQDLTGNNDYFTADEQKNESRYMQNAGVVITTSQAVLKELRAPHP